MSRSAKTSTRAQPSHVPHEIAGNHPAAIVLRRVVHEVRGLTRSTIGYSRKAAEKATGLLVVGEGATRVVLALDSRLVLKISWSESDDVSNEVEAGTWRSARDDIREWLAPVLAIPKEGPLSWLVMARAEPLKGNVPDAASWLAEELQDTTGESALFSSNWGRIDDHPVLVDYA